MKRNQAVQVEVEVKIEVKMAGQRSSSERAVRFRESNRWMRLLKARYVQVLDVWLRTGLLRAVSRMRRRE